MNLIGILEWIIGGLAEAAIIGWGLSIVMGSSLPLIYEVIFAPILVFILLYSLVDVLGKIGSV